MPEIEADIELLLQSNGKSQVKEWLESFRDKPRRAKIDRQIDKLAIGLVTKRDCRAAFQRSR